MYGQGAFVLNGKNEYSSRLRANHSVAKAVNHDVQSDPVPDLLTSGFAPNFISPPGYLCQLYGRQSATFCVGRF